MTTSPALTVAVLSYNGRHLLEVILPSLAHQRFRDFEVVVVDNGSRDDTRQWLKEHWPDLQIVSLSDNIGVTAALNVCAQAGQGEFVGLFNNDIELHPDCLGELVGALQEHADAGWAGGKLIDFYRRDTIDGAGDVFTWAGSGHRRGHGERDRGNATHRRPSSELVAGRPSIAGERCIPLGRSTKTSTPSTRTSTGTSVRDSRASPVVTFPLLWRTTWAAHHRPGADGFHPLSAVAQHAVDYRQGCACRCARPSLAGAGPWAGDELGSGVVGRQALSVARCLARCGPRPSGRSAQATGRTTQEADQRASAGEGYRDAGLLESSPMLVSVLLPTHNRLEYLRYAVESVRRQDATDWEIVVSDDASEEDIAGFVDGLMDPRVRYVRTDRFVPVTDNWNNALRHSRGDYS